MCLLWHVPPQKRLTCKWGRAAVSDLQRVLRLTEKGRSMAQQVHEKQMFFEHWLMQAGVAPACARADACRIKHAVSEES